jgi:hypothetical protein
MTQDEEPFGPSHPLGKRYAYEFGVMAVSFVYLEDLLRDYVLHRRILAAQWPLQPKKLERLLAALEQASLSELVDDFAGFETGSPTIAVLRSIRPKRNALMHVVLPTIETATHGVDERAILEHCGRFRRITTQVHAAMRGVVAADNELFHLMEERRKLDPAKTLVDLGKIGSLMTRRVEKAIATLDG